MEQDTEKKDKAVKQDGAKDKEIKQDSAKDKGGFPASSYNIVKDDEPKPE